MHKKNNSGEALEPALPWANVPLFAPAMALLGSAAIAVSALAIFAPADLRMVTHTAPAPALVVQTPATPPAINFLALIGTSTNSAGPAAIAGYPDITVPMGFVSGLPAGVSFFGRAWSEPTLLRVAYAFEQATNHRRAPTFAPTLG